MKAGYIETQLDSESPDVSRKGRQTRAKGAEPLQEGGGRPRNTDAVKRQNVQNLVPGLRQRFSPFLTLVPV